GGLRDAVELGGERADFFVECLAVGGRVGGVGRLDGQFADALEDVAGGLECAFGGLGQRNAVVGVAAGLVETTDLRGHALGDRQTGGVVLGGVDAQTGRQTLQRGAERGGRVVQVALRVE